MSKLYIGEQEITTGGGGGVSGDYVDISTWNEHEKVVASALLDLKGLEDDIEAFDDKIETHVEAIDTQIQGLQTSKADVSVVYTKSDIDKSDKVAAAAIASLDSRVSVLENSGSGSGSGSAGVSLEVLDASLKAYTYDKAHIDASISAVSQGGGSVDLTDYVFVDRNQYGYDILKVTQANGSVPLTELEFTSLKTLSIQSSQEVYVGDETFDG